MLIMSASDIKPSGEDLAYLSALARSGEDAPLSGGRFLVWWAGLASLVILAHWAIITGLVPFGADALWVLWIGFMVIGSIGSVFLGITIRNKPGLGSAANRTEASVWLSVGVSMFAIFAGIVTGVLSGLLDQIFFNVMLPVTLAGYGAAWMTVAQVSRRPGLNTPAILSFMGAAAGMAFAGTAWVYPISALALFGASAVPGFVLMRNEARSVSA